MNLTLRKKKIRSPWKTIASCMYPENITGMIRDVFYTDTIDAKKISNSNSNSEYEIWNLKGKVDFLRVRFDIGKNRFLFEQKFN